VCRSHCGGLAVYIKKYQKAKEEEELYGNINISPCKNIIFEKNSSQRNQNPSRFLLPKCLKNFKKNPAFLTNQPTNRWFSFSPTVFFDGNHWWWVL
jgi:hypothetical protein